MFDRSDRTFHYTCLFLTLIGHHNFVMGLDPASPNDCTITLARKFLNDRAPLFLHYTPLGANRTQFYLPHTRQESPTRRVNYLHIRHDESVMLACPGENNQILGLADDPERRNEISRSRRGPETQEQEPNYPQSMAAILCHDRKFSAQHRRVDIQKLTCKESMAINVENTGQCGPEGKAESYKIGFKVGSIDETLLDACFDPVTLSTLYTRHTLRGGSLKSAVQTKNKRGYSNVQKLYGSVDPENLYKPKTQRENLWSKTEKSPLAKFVLSRTQLVPRKDFPLKAWRRAADLYVNVVPQWKNIRKGNWAKLEINIRRLAMERNLDLDIITGILNDVKPAGSIGKLPSSPARPAFLDPTNGKIAIPDFIYKIVVDPASNQGIAFVADNNPLNTVGQMCKSDICADTLWPSYKQSYSGIIYCCTVSEVTALLPGVPQVHVQGVLKGSETLLTDPNFALERLIDEVTS